MKAHKGKAFLRQLTAQRVHTFLQRKQLFLLLGFETWGPFACKANVDDHYTTETCSQGWVCLFHRTLLGTWIKLQIALHSLICKYLLFLAANTKKVPVFCWNPQDFHFCINYSLATVFVPLGRKAYLVLSSSSTESYWTIVKNREIVPAQFRTGDLSRVRRTW